jgi:hypothetical protein
VCARTKGSDDDGSNHGGHTMLYDDGSDGAHQASHTQKIMHEPTVQIPLPAPRVAHTGMLVRASEFEPQSFSFLVVVVWSGRPGRT